MYGGKFAFQNRLGKFQVQAPRGAYIRRGHLTEVFFALRFWGAYIWRGLYMEFYGICYSSLVEKIAGFLAAKKD